MQTAKPVMMGTELDRTTKKSSGMIKKKQIIVNIIVARVEKSGIKINWFLNKSSDESVIHLN